MEINGVLLEFNALDADVLERYENALATMQEESKKDFSGSKNSEILREQCCIIHRFFDGVFGDGTSQSVFLGKYDLKVCMQAAGALIEEANRQFSEINSFAAKYSPNRAQRRAAK